ncbi:hypothetical protein OPT61_g3761 [Boeremia exigua]|uniref:Uncharacterized protein n=1 Tax=Boeremia exigua TaxID=749465 RepID=A0ACC2IGV5_9PLEO|nr:hypothetical protein OPT61_g3761 [Boeremia exigua]
MSSLATQVHDLSRQHASEDSTEPQPSTLFPVNAQAVERSQAIDRALEEDAKALKRKINILPLGAFSMREIAEQLKNNGDTSLTESERADYRYNIHQCVITSIRALLSLIKESKIQTDEVKHRYDYLCDYMVGHQDAILNEEAGQATDSLWNNPYVKGLVQSSAKSDLKESYAYFFQEISRIAAPNYIPTETDILQSHKGIRGISEHRFLANGLTINLIDVGTQRCERRKWIHQFDDITAILFVADLPCYDQEVSGRNTLTEQIELFDNVINTKSFRSSRFILFLNNVSAFRQKLLETPLRDHFPDFSGGTNFEQAREYLLRRFGHVNRSSRKLYPHFVDPGITSNIELVVAAIQDKSD